MKCLLALVLAIGLGLAGAVRAQTSQPTTEPAVGRAVYVGDEMIMGYDPDPALVTQQTRVDRPKHPAIDIHCHWDDEVDPHFVLSSMDELGLQAAINLSGGYGERLDRMLAKYHAVAPDRLLIFANIDFSRIDEPDFGQHMARFLEEAHRKGISGLKIYKNLGLTIRDKSGQIVPVDDPRLDPIWDKCGELGLPVLIHSGDPIAFFQPIDEKNERWMQLRRHPDWSFHGQDFPTYDEVMAQQMRMIASHPETTFISAHLANSGENLEQLSQWMEAQSNLYVDISGRVSELGRQPYAARTFLIKYQDRVLFGTDRYPGRPDQPRYTVYYRFLETDDEYFKYYDHPFPPNGDWRIYGVFLPDEVLKKIYHDNAARVLWGKSD